MSAGVATDSSASSVAQHLKQIVSKTEAEIRRLQVLQKKLQQEEQELLQFISKEDEAGQSVAGSRQAHQDDVVHHAIN